MAGVTACGGSGGSGDAELNRPWTRARLSDDGRELTVWVEPPGDDECEVFDRIEVDRNDDSAAVAAVYIRTDMEFCEVPCPLTDEARTVQLDRSLSGLELKPEPDTDPSCRP